MAKEKKIKRTIIIGYKYDVLEKNGTTMEILGSVVNDTVIRSIKESRNVLVANGYDEDCVLVQTGLEQKVYEMPESTFMQYATVVEDI